VPVEDEEAARELVLRGVRRRTTALRDKEEPVLLLALGESGDRRARLLLVGVSLIEDAVTDELERVSELYPSCESPSIDADWVSRSESVEVTTC
jgi:hypothetical protein